MKGFYLSFDLWATLGLPDVDDYVYDMDDNGFWLDIDTTDADGNEIPDFLEKISSGGGDVILNPSHGVVGG